VEGAEGGANWNERREEKSDMGWIFLSEVQ